MARRGVGQALQVSDPGGRVGVPDFEWAVERGQNGGCLLGRPGKPGCRCQVVQGRGKRFP
jgi:hypothetical protein